MPGVVPPVAAARPRTPLSDAASRREGGPLCAGRIVHHLDVDPPRALSATLCAMKTQRLFGVACLLVLAWSTAARAQLAPANDMGVALGHMHLAVKDVEANKQFFTTMLGGKLVTNRPLTLIEFPGIFVMLRQADAAASPAGSVIDHFGLVYKDIEAARARWKSGGVKYDV